MRTLLPISLILLAACDAAPPTQSSQVTEAAPAVQTPPPRYDAAAFYETTSYFLSQSPAWSADETRLLIASDENGTVNAYALSVADGSRVALTQSTTDAQFPVSWFPADDRALIRADQGGNELDHLYVRETDGTLKDLTPGENLKAVFGDWNDAGTHFYVVTNERDPKAFDLYRYAASDYERELIFRNEDNWALAGGSGDERYLTLMRINSTTDTDVYLFDTQLDGAEPVLITPHEGDVSHSVYGFTPDNAKVIYSTDGHGEFTEAWTYDIASGEHAPYVNADWDLSFLFFSDSGRYRITGVNADARTDIEILDSKTGAPLALPNLPDGDLAQIRFSRKEQKLALMVTSDTSPADIFTVDLAANTSQRLTNALNPAIDEENLVAATVIRYPSFDELEIPGILYRPKGASASHKVPALVWVHGGPGGQSRLGYSATLQHLVNHGYAILAANNRGSSGYGKTFFHMDDRKHGEVDLDDIVHAEKYLAGLDWVDADRIGIIGGSYGGYMVGAALAFRPEVFKVGIDIFGVMNWVRTLESIPPWWEQQRKGLYDELGDPATDGERLRRISPLFHAGNISVPLLVVQGANDPRVLQVESDEIVAAVRENEVPVEYIVFPDEGHGFTQRSNRIRASDAYVGFLDRYL